MTTPEQLESSILTAAVLACDKCGKIDAIEEWANNYAEAAKYFYEEGWRRTKKGLIYCPECLSSPAPTGA